MADDRQPNNEPENGVAVAPLGYGCFVWSIAAIF
jgi:hypothetical protein